MIRAIQVVDLHTPQGQARLASYLKDLYTKVIPTITGSGAPTAIPSQIGQQYIDTLNHKVYTATGLKSNNWMLLN